MGDREMIFIWYHVCLVMQSLLAGIGGLCFTEYVTSMYTELSHKFLPIDSAAMSVVTCQCKTNCATMELSCSAIMLMVARTSDRSILF